MGNLEGVRGKGKGEWGMENEEIEIGGKSCEHSFGVIFKSFKSTTWR